jgi:hypothetical protein
VGSRTSARQSSPLVEVLVSPSSHDKSVDFLHHGLSNQQHDCRGQPWGSPKKPGESSLKPAKNKTKRTSYLNTHTRHGPHCGGPRGPPEWPNQRPPRAGSASLEGPHPLERVPPRSRARVPSGGLRLARGSPPPSSGFPSRSRLPHTRTCSRTRAQAFNALTQQSRAITRLGITPRRCSANSLGETRPRHCGGLFNETGVSSVTLCRPLPYG